MPPHCRFYEAQFPEVDDVVMVSVRSIQDMGAYVHLLEYDGIEGMILLSELSRRRIRSINKLVRVGRNECVVVLRVDKEKVRPRFVPRRPRTAAAHLGPTPTCWPLAMPLLPCRCFRSATRRPAAACLLGAASWHVQRPPPLSWQGLPPPIIAARAPHAASC